MMIPQMEADAPADAPAAESAPVPPPPDDDAGTCALFLCCDPTLCVERRETEPRLNLLMCLPPNAEGTSLATKVHLGALILQVVLQFVFYGLAEAGAWDSLYAFDGCLTTACRANQAMMAVGLAFSAWFSFLWIGTVPLRFICGRAMHYDCWIMNLLMVGGLVFGAVCIPHPFYTDVYVHVTRYFAAILFLPMQTLAMIDLGYRWRDTWADPPPEACGDSKPGDWRRALIISAAVLWLLEYAMIALFWVWFAGYGECAWQNLVICCYAACQLVLLFLPCWLDHASPVVSVLLGFVSTLYMFDGFINLDDRECSMIEVAGGSISLGFSPLRLLSFVLGAFFALQTVTAIMASQRAEQAALVAAGTPPRPPGASERNIGVLHAGCCIASAFITMVGTGWGLSDSDSQNAVLAGIRFGSVGMSMLLYLWTLVGPLVCKDRDFGRATAG